MVGYYNDEELKELGLKEVGERVFISKKASIISPESISIGHDVRIDDFCFLVGNITIGNFVHLAPYASIHGTGGGSVIMKDFTALSGYSTIYAASDDYLGEALTNPMTDEKYRMTHKSDIILEKHCIVGLHSVILPGAYLAEGTALGAMSFLAKDTEPWGVYIGIPCRRKKERSRKMLDLEKKFLDDLERRGRYTN